MLLNINLDKIADLDFKTKEAYKTLRTNVQFCGENVKVVSLTSCVPNEGKSMVAFNLAVSMAESGKKVLFVDALEVSVISPLSLSCKNTTASGSVSYCTLSGSCRTPEAA